LTRISSIRRIAWKALRLCPAVGGDVAAVVDSLGLQDLVLVGHSMGGDVIVEAAVPLRDRVRGLVWVDVYPSLAQISTREEIDAFVEPFRTDFSTNVAAFVRTMFLPSVDPVLVNWVVNDMAAAPPEIALDALVHSIANDGPVIGRLEELNLPVVAINADYEPTDEASLLRHGVRPVIMTGVSHFPMMEDPDQFNRVLEGVLAEFGFS
jgi:pimeloyl-ACP methyl ester carboxylesterase